jgi:hypothetical protein
VVEKTQVQAPGRTQPLLPMRPGQAALDVKLGTIHGAASRATAELEAAIHDYIAVTNATPKPFRWTKTADDILASIHRFCLKTAPQPTLLTTSESAHYCTGSKRWYRLIMAGWSRRPDRTSVKPATVSPHWNLST